MKTHPPAWCKLSQSKCLQFSPIPTTDVSVFGQNSHFMKDSAIYFSQDEEIQQMYTQLIALLEIKLIK